MKILIDADGCPVVDATIKLCQKYKLPCQLVCDTAHEFRRSGADTIIVGKGADSADYALLKLISSGDVVVTQDYGLAAMSLTQGAQVLNQDGWWYTSENIDALLLTRHLSRKARAAGNRVKGPHKRTASQDAAFCNALETYLQTSVQG